MSAYYNEHDVQKAAWLRELIARNLIAPGDVDERSIEIVQPEELRGYTQCHFFAGIGVWSYALRNAGWPDDAPVWTGSCPCQGFSASGKRGGFSDKRHLWPAWFRVLRECRPDVVFGEQVASPDGVAWLDVVSADMEGAGYAIGAADLCAAGVGAPHIRQRLFFVGYSERARLEGYAWPSNGSERRSRSTRSTLTSSAADRLAEPDSEQLRGRSGSAGDSASADVRGAGEQRLRSDAGECGPTSSVAQPDEGGCGVIGSPRVHGGGASGNDPDRCGSSGAVADASSAGVREDSGSVRRERSNVAGDGQRLRDGADAGSATLGMADTAGGGFGEVPVGSAPAEATREGKRGLVPRAGSVVGDSESGGWRERGDEAHAGGGGHADRAVLTGFWANAEWIPCTDGKARPVEPGSSPLAHGAPFRVVRLRGYGDGIVGPLAEEFIEASCEILEIGQG